MSDALKVGDRVRVVGCEKMKPLDVFAARIMHGEVKGEIQSLHGTWSIVNFEGHNYHMKNANLQRIPSRTFEEICKELKETMEERSWTVELSSCGAAHVMKNREVHCIIGCDGTLEIIIDEGSSFFDVRDLAAIAAACTEIADNYQAEHRKENQQ